MDGRASITDIGRLKAAATSAEVRAGKAAAKKKPAAPKGE
jgi:hypothetical protein